MRQFFAAAAVAATLLSGSVMGVTASNAAPMPHGPDAPVFAAPASHQDSPAQKCWQLYFERAGLLSQLSNLQEKFKAAEEDGNSVLAWYFQQRIYYVQNQVNQVNDKMDALPPVHDCNTLGGPVPSPIPTS